jgi:hypothetical protein
VAALTLGYISISKPVERLFLRPANSGAVTHSGVKILVVRRGSRFSGRRSNPVESVSCAEI